jgi:hypothetical protein
VVPPPRAGPPGAAPHRRRARPAGDIDQQRRDAAPGNTADIDAVPPRLCSAEVSLADGGPSVRNTGSRPIWPITATLMRILCPFSSP